MATFAYKVRLRTDRYEVLRKSAVSTEEGIRIGVLPESNQDYVERRNPQTGDILWCQSEDFFEDSEEFLEFLSNEGFSGNPFTETT